jgi:hypothetical protein
MGDDAAFLLAVVFATSWAIVMVLVTDGDGD